jgi:hypothetical protein
MLEKYFFKWPSMSELLVMLQPNRGSLRELVPGLSMLCSLFSNILGTKERKLLSSQQLQFLLVIRSSNESKKKFANSHNRLPTLEARRP